MNTANWMEQRHGVKSRGCGIGLVGTHCSPQDSYVEDLLPKVRVLGGGAFGRSNTLFKHHRDTLCPSSV